MVTLTHTNCCFVIHTSVLHPMISVPAWNKKNSFFYLVDVLLLWQVNRENHWERHKHGLLQLPGFRWKQCRLPENCGRGDQAVWGGRLQHKTGTRYVCGYTATRNTPTKTETGSAAPNIVCIRTSISRLLSNYISLVNTIINLSKAVFFPRCDQTRFEQRS